jgi:hypothetical protein
MSGTEVAVGIRSAFVWWKKRDGEAEAELAFAVNTPYIIYIYTYLQCIHTIHIYDTIPRS